MATLPPPTLAARPPGAKAFPLNVSRCGECATAVPDHHTHCPECRQTTGPFTPLVGFTVIVEDHHGQRWLCLFHQDGTHITPRWARRCTSEQARWITRQPDHTGQ